MRYSSITTFIMMCIILTSCTGQKTGEKNDHNDEIAIEVGEVKFPPQEVLQLKSYYLSSSVYADSTNYLIGYNYQSHALDCMNLKSKSITQVVLSGEGPDAIVRLSGIYAQSLDSIWVSDESQRVFLIDRVGKVKRMINMKDYMEDKEQLAINTNYAMFTSHLFYHSARHALMFLVKNTESNAFLVKEVSIDKKNEVLTYGLSRSEVISDMSEGYAYNNYPNVNFSEDKIIYNYPVESSIYMLDIKTKERKSYQANSRYTSNIVPKCTTGKDYASMEKHRLENPHFYDVMYLPKWNLYARLHVDKVDFDKTKDIEKLMNARDLYLMLFDENMQKVAESKLANHRYNLFTGWSATYDCIALFVGNILDEENQVDDLIVDVISPKRNE